MFHSPSALADISDQVDFSTYLTRGDVSTVRDGPLNSSIVDDDLVIEPDVTGFAVDDGDVATFDVSSQVQYVNDALQSLGYKVKIDVESTEIPAIRDIIQTFKGFIQQRRNDIDFRSNSNEEKKKLQSDNHSLRDSLTQTRKDLDKTVRELEHQKYKLVAAEKTWKKTQEKMEKERAKVDLKATQVANRDQQYQHEIRKKERTYNKLQQRMQSMIADRDRAAKAGMAILNKLQRSDGKRGTWGSGPGKAAQHEQELLQNVIGDYEEKQKMLVEENAEIRQTMRELRDELDTLLAERNEQKSVPSGDSDATSASLSEDIDGGNAVTDGQYELPFAMVKGDIELHLRTKLDELRSQISTLSGSVVPTANGEAALKEQVAQLRSIVQEQDALLQFSLQAASTPSAGALDDSTMMVASSDAAVTSEERQLFEQSRRALQEERAKLTDALLELGAERTRLMAERAKYESGDATTAAETTSRSLFSPPVQASTPARTPGFTHGTPLFLKSFRKRSAVKHTPTPSGLTLTPVVAEGDSRVLNSVDPNLADTVKKPGKASARSLNADLEVVTLKEN